MPYLKLFIYGCMTLLCAQPLYAFRVVTNQGQIVRWTQSYVPYSIHRNALDYVDTSAFPDIHPEETIQTAIHSGFHSWQHVGAQIQFGFAGMSDVVNTGNDGQNTLTWIGSNWNRRLYGSTNVIAVTISTFQTRTGRILDSDIHFNATHYCWNVRNLTTSTPSSCMDTQNIATHEIGHAIGLDHSSEDANELRPLLNQASMFYASYPGDVTRRLLNLDDQRAILANYPVNNGHDPTVATFDPPNAQNFETDFTLQVQGAGFSDTSMIRLYHPEAKIDLVGIIEELHGNQIKASFNLVGMPPGDLEVWVNNDYNSMNKSTQTLRLDGEEVAYIQQNDVATSSGGGCGVMLPLKQDEERAATSLICMLIALMLLITQRWRLGKR